MGKIFVMISLALVNSFGFCQTPRTYTSSEILLQIKKLNVLGSVLYIAAHPDDENTRLLAYLANEKLYRTGYLSLTRGDGGQNLIGDEQGVDLGLIRTQELLSARRIDGAEQFFSRAFDFGFSKSPDEAMRTWGHDKILSDVVWVIRKFRPDVIITRFPTTGEGGHGHHTASAILAGEAFDAAADPKRFPEQLKNGVTVWQAKRLLWNTFNFGSTNTQSEDQFKLDCGDFNPIIGKSYGEIAAASRSQHKSQGFGVAAQRGSVIEYFKTIKGEAPIHDLMEGVNMSWDRTLFGGQLISRPVHEDNAENLADSIFKNFSVEHPEKSIRQLVRMYGMVQTSGDNYWREQKSKEIRQLIEECSALFMDATTNTQYAVQGDSLKINMVLNNRLGANISAVTATLDNVRITFEPLKKNISSARSYTLLLNADSKITQPYWLERPMEKGSFDVRDQQLIGMGENDPWSVEFNVTVEGVSIPFRKPIRYRYTDPVKGELYQPLSIIPVADVKFDKETYVSIRRNALTADLKITPALTRNTNFVTEVKLPVINSKSSIKGFSSNGIQKDKPIHYGLKVENEDLIKEQSTLTASIKDAGPLGIRSNSFSRMINYDHIPSIVYQKPATAKSVYVDLKIRGRLVGYIPGAGDKVPEALTQMGYRVVTLHENELNPVSLRQFDAIVTGVRAYNTQPWLINAYDALMQYVKEGGVLLVQYNTNNSLGPMRSRIGPYPFTIGGKRITDEEAKVKFLIPGHVILNEPNKITEKDFEGWIQERSTYHAESIDTAYRRILSMHDPGEAEDDGALIVGNYGKGRFVYAGLVFFRELPAGVPGAYRLFANLIANDRGKYIK
jgi:LmbE family N-acetylglucosaminyl deacetylase